MQPRPDPVHPHFGQRLDQRLHQRVPPGAVADPHPPQVTVQLTAGEKVGEGVLLDARDAEVRLPLLPLHRLQQPGRHHQPP